MNCIKGKSKTFADPKLIRSEIRCKPNHKNYYLRSDLDVMVADISPLFGTPTFLYKMIDDFKSPPDGDQFIIPKNKIIYNPAGFYENGWTDDLNEITNKLFSNDYNLRNYNTNVPEQIITTKRKCIDLMSVFQYD